MAKNGAKGAGRHGELDKQSKIKPPKEGSWTKRDPGESPFPVMVRENWEFKGVKREV